MSTPAERLQEKGVPVRLHPPSEMMEVYVKAFVATHPAEIERLRGLMNREQDTASVMNSFLAFLRDQGFDRQRYSELEVFGALLRAVRQ